MPADPLPRRPAGWTAFSASAFAGTLVLWAWLVGQRLSWPVTALALVGPLVLVYPVALAGRRMLDTAPTPERAAKVTAVVHAAVVLLIGVAVVVAVNTAVPWRGLLALVTPALPSLRPRARPA